MGRESVSDGSSNKNSDGFENTIENLEQENSYLREHVNRLENTLERRREEIERLQEQIEQVFGSDDPVAFEIEKTTRSSEDSIETELEVTNRKNRIRKRLAYISNILLSSVILMAYLISNPPTRSVVAEHEIPVATLTITLMLIWWQTEGLITDYSLDEKYSFASSIIEVIEEEQWAPWILRATFGVLSLIIFAYSWDVIRSVIHSIF